MVFTAINSALKDTLFELVYRELNELLIAVNIPQLVVGVEKWNMVCKRFQCKAFVI